jgi:hypothetical protein
VFDFFGFTHYCTRSHKWGSFVIARKTIKKRMLRTLGAIKVDLRKRMHDPIAERADNHMDAALARQAAEAVERRRAGLYVVGGSAK